MIITKIRGGLGCQLFQYAAGHAAALRHNQTHLLDTRFFGNGKFRNFGLVGDDKHRIYGLGQFNISAGVAPNEMLPPAKEEMPFRYAAWKHFRTRPRYVRDTECASRSTIDPELVKRKLACGSYLSGLWCSETFFVDFASEIRKELTLKDQFSAKGSNFLKQIKSTTAVSLHVRRGDLARNKNLTQKFGICSIDYYSRAMRYLIRELGKEPNIFVFSDDLPWARQNLNVSAEMVFVDAASNRMPQEDLMLMAACDHHIAANSTFSWWGAWLGGNSDKLVICPEGWFASRKKLKYNMTPRGWVSLPAFA